MAKVAGFEITDVVVDQIDTVGDLMRGIERATARRRNERRFMALVLKPNDASPGDYHVMHGELQVGHIYKRIVAGDCQLAYIR